MPSSFPIRFLSSQDLGRFSFYQQEPRLWEGIEGLWLQGRPGVEALLEKLPACGLTVVGTRTPYLRTCQWLSRCLETLRGTDLVLLSGLARGIDGIVHEAALQAGLPTIAILGSGLEAPTYPPEHAGLRQRILEAGGFLLSEWPGETPPLGFHFLRRNRFLAVLAQALWIVQAGWRSGALNTAAWGRQLSRTCYATPCFPGDFGFAGNQSLLDRDQAQPFWTVQSLGSTWLSLATWRQQSGPTQQQTKHAEPLERSQLDLV